jgi:hypothetical protein
MVYLVIKELSSSAEDVIMVTSSIMKDTAVGSDVLYRANAIRSLCRIIDVSTPILRMGHAKISRLQLYNQLNDPLRLPLSIKHLQSPRRHWYPPTISFQLPAMWCVDGRVRPKKPLRRQRPVVGSRLGSPAQGINTLLRLPTLIT